MRKHNNYCNYGKNILILLFFLGTFTAICQIPTGVYLHILERNGVKHVHQIKIKDTYFIYTIYENNPNNFIKTVGGFYQTDGQQLQVDLEFNSNFEIDSIKTWSVPFRMKNNDLILELEAPITFEPSGLHPQDLDGTWLFATRGPDVGQDRRGGESSRKTLKFLMGGTFQWIAYDTESFKFFGSGGGSYSAVDGLYKEQIEFFSRDNTRVGATLEFNFERIGNDWHHTGKNSKGEPMYEIWARRE